MVHKLHCMLESPGSFFKILTLRLHPHYINQNLWEGDQASAGVLGCLGLFYKSSRDSSVQPTLRTKDLMKLGTTMSLHLGFIFPYSLGFCLIDIFLMARMLEISLWVYWGVIF